MLLFRNKNQYKLQRRKDIKFEVEYQLNTIKISGNKVMDVIERDTECLIVYRLLYDKPEIKENSFQIRIRVINLKGVMYDHVKLDSFIKDYKYISIADIVTPKHLENKGYASILLNKLIQFSKDKNLLYIDGYIAQVDYDHLDKLYYFYQKHGFEINPDGHKLLFKITQ